MSETEKKVKAFLISNFHDDGTKERFEAGDTPTFDEGRFGNYKAAGLVRKFEASDAPAKKGDGKTEA
jgi:hypothetical protein